MQLNSRWLTIVSVMEHSNAIPLLRFAWGKKKIIKCDYSFLNLSKPMPICCFMSGKVHFIAENILAILLQIINRHTAW